MEVRTESVCQEAERIVNGARQETYGSPAENFKRVADLWTDYLGDDLTRPIVETDVCLMMIALKLARVRTGRSYHRDSVVDICGYALLAEMLAE